MKEIKTKSLESIEASRLICKSKKYKEGNDYLC